MKSILFYSPDLNLCASLLMFFNEKYAVTTTTDLSVVGNIFNSARFDLLVIDSEPTNTIIELCKSVHEKHTDIPVISTYVYTNKFGDKEAELKNFVDIIFYKPIDLFEVSQKIDRMMFQPAE
jgi:DNA-binding response OmpR family regulator